MNLSKHLTRIAAGLLAVAAMATPAFAASGTVDAAKGLNLRNGTGTTAAVLATLPDGAQVEVTGVTEEGWYQITYQDLEGYVSGEYVALSEADKQSLAVVSEPVYGKITDGPLNVRSLPSTDSDRVRQLSAGAVVQIISTQDGWYEISDGYICADYVQIVDASEAVSSGAGDQLVAYAKQFLGYPYVYGGVSPSGFDCSGFAKYVYAHFGVELSHSSSAQINSGVRVSANELQPGDLVFFAQTSSGSISHVGIYIGNGEFIHASSPSTGVIISSMSSHSARGFVGACRIL